MATMAQIGTLELTKTQREIAEWALPALVEYWTPRHRMEFWRPILTPAGLNLGQTDQRIIEDLIYRIENQFPDCVESALSDMEISPQKAAGSIRAAMNLAEAIRGHD